MEVSRTISAPGLDGVARLHRAGLRPTRQRQALAALLFGAPGQPVEDRHVTAEDLHMEARDRDLRVSLATVYNTLHQFTRAGLLREVVVDSGRSYFDTNTSDHHHFYLVDGAMLTDIPGPDIEMAAIPSAPVGMEVERVEVVIRLRKSA
jgi:Fur family transcriptional regulator, iron response regulator